MENYVPSRFKIFFNKTTLCALIQPPSSKLHHIFNYISVTNFVPWEIEEMANTLEQELGWERPNAPELPMRFDCELEDGFIDYTYKSAIGSTLRGIMCKHLIFAGTKSKKTTKDYI